MPDNTENRTTASRLQTDSARIRIWTAPTVRPSVVALTRGELCLVPVARSSNVGAVREKLEGEPNPSKVLGWRDTLVPLGAITSVCLDKIRGELLISHTVLDKEGKEKTEIEFVKFKDLQAADDFLRALQTRLGPDWGTRTKQYSRLQASLKPFAAIVVVMAGYLVGFGIRDPLANVLFALVILACFVWLLLYLIKPPLITFLERGDPK
jgi:hypothetical protein